MTCPDCSAALAEARALYESAATERARTAEIYAEIVAMHAEAKQLLARTIQLNRRASLDLAQTDNAH